MRKPGLAARALALVLNVMHITAAAADAPEPWQADYERLAMYRCQFGHEVADWAAEHGFAGVQVLEPIHGNAMRVWRSADLADMALAFARPDQGQCVLGVSAWEAAAGRFDYAQGGYLYPAPQMCIRPAAADAWLQHYELHALWQSSATDGAHRMVVWVGPHGRAAGVVKPDGELCIALHDLSGFPNEAREKLFERLGQ